MTVSIAHLGPPGTHAEAATLTYTQWLANHTHAECILCPYPSIAQTLQALAAEEVQLAVVPVENSIEGGVTITLDTLWQLDILEIQHALVLPIFHALITLAPGTDSIKTVYSHPQALAQCQNWLGQNLCQAQLIPTNSTTEKLQDLATDTSAAVIASQRAAQLYQLPILVHPINDYPDNYTRFWICRHRLQADPSLYPPGTHSAGTLYTSLGFSVPANVPGALVKPLAIFAQRNINLSRIESRPTKRSLGDYLFFVDIEANTEDPAVQSALTELATYTETLKILGSYPLIKVDH